MVAAVPGAVVVTAHLFHGTIVVVGAIVVLAMLIPDWRHRRDLAELRKAIDSGTLIQRAERRAGMADTLAAPGRAWTITVAAIASVVAAGVHAWVCPEHFREALRLGLFFLVASAAQVVWAGLILRRSSRSLLLLSAVGNAGIVALWIVTRTVGLPFGLAEEVESVGGLDVLATAAELVIVLTCAAALLEEQSRLVTPEYRRVAT